MNRQVILIDRCSLTFMEATVSSKKMAVKAFFRLPIGDAGISDSLRNDYVMRWSELMSSQKKRHLYSLPPQ